VNLIAAGLSTPLSASILGDQLESREQTRRRCRSGASSAQRHRQAGRPPRDEHGGHWRDLRHRRRPTVVEG
jgi:hypothetical protein